VGNLLSLKLGCAEGTYTKQPTGLHDIHLSCSRGQLESYIHRKRDRDRDRIYTEDRSAPGSTHTSSSYFVLAKHTQKMGTMAYFGGEIERWRVLLCFIDPRVRKIRNEASRCPGIFSRTLRFYYVASSPVSQGTWKLVGC